MQDTQEGGAGSPASDKDGVSEQPSTSVEMASAVASTSAVAPTSVEMNPVKGGDGSEGAI